MAATLVAAEIALCNRSLDRLGATNFTSGDGSDEEAQCESHYDATRDALLRSHSWRFAARWVDLVRDARTDYGTSTDDTNTSLKLYDTGQAWTDDEYEDYYLWITGGTGANQIRTIESNQETYLVPSVAFTTTPDATSTYEIWENYPPYPWGYQYDLPSDYLRFIESTPKHALFAIDGSMLKSDEGEMAIQYVWQETTVGNFDPSFTESLVVLLASKICMPLLHDKVLYRELRDEFQVVVAGARVVNLREVVTQPDKASWSDARFGWVNTPR